MPWLGLFFSHMAFFFFSSVWRFEHPEKPGGREALIACLWVCVCVFFCCKMMLACALKHIYMDSTMCASARGSLNATFPRRTMLRWNEPRRIVCFSAMHSLQGVMLSSLFITYTGRVPSLKRNQGIYTTYFRAQPIPTCILFSVVLHLRWLYFGSKILTLCEVFGFCLHGCTGSVNYDVKVGKDDQYSSAQVQRVLDTIWDDNLFKWYSFQLYM